MAASDFYATLTAAGVAHHSAGRHSDGGGAEADGTINSGDPVKTREYEQKVRDIARKMSDDELTGTQKHYERPQTRAQQIVKDELNREQIRRRTTPRG